MSRAIAGTIVIVDWRGGAMPKKPNRSRPAIVVEDHPLFDDDYPNILVVPLTDDRLLAIPWLSVTIKPSADNGYGSTCYALSQSVTAVSKQRVKVTESRITGDQLLDIRRGIAEAIGSPSGA